MARRFLANAGGFDLVGQAMTAPTYSDREIVETLDMARAGISAEEIAEKTGLTLMEVVGVVRMYTDGLVAARADRQRVRAMHHGGRRPGCGAKRGPRHRLTDEQRSRILQLRSEGLTYHDIARSVVCTEYQARYVAELGR